MDFQPIFFFLIFLVNPIVYAARRLIESKKAQISSKERSLVIRGKILKAKSNSFEKLLTKNKENFHINLNSSTSLSMNFTNNAPLKKLASQTARGKSYFSFFKSKKKFLLISLPRAVKTAKKRRTILSTIFGNLNNLKVLRADSISKKRKIKKKLKRGRIKTGAYKSFFLKKPSSLQIPKHPKKFDFSDPRSPLRLRNNKRRSHVAQSNSKDKSGPMTIKEVNDFLETDYANQGNPENGGKREKPFRKSRDAYHLRSLTISHIGPRKILSFGSMSPTMTKKVHLKPKIKTSLKKKLSKSCKVKRGKMFRLSGSGKKVKQNFNRTLKKFYENSKLEKIKGRRKKLSHTSNDFNSTYVSTEKSLNSNSNKKSFSTQVEDSFGKLCYRRINKLKKSLNPSAKDKFRHKKMKKKKYPLIPRFVPGALYLPEEILR